MDDLTGTGALSQKRGRRTVWLILGGGLLLLLLVGAAFVAGGLLTRQPQEGAFVRMEEGGATYRTFTGPVERPEELPDEEPDVAGVVTRRDGNSLFLGTGNSVKIGVGPDGATDVEYDGPEVEVVVTHDTEIYEERIEFQEDTVRDIVEPGSLENIGRGNSVQVWGEKRGDRVVARVLVYQATMAVTVRP